MLSLFKPGPMLWTLALGVAMCPAIGQAASFIPLGDLPGGPFFSAGGGVSPDGTAVTGYSISTDAQNPEAFVWTLKNGMKSLGFLPNAAISYGSSVSNGGQFVVGYGYPDYYSSSEAFVWSQATGMVGLGDGFAADISPAGDVVVGYGPFGAFRWTASEGMRLLPASADGHVMPTAAYAISHDGRVIVGQGRSSRYYKAFIWTESAGTALIGDLEDGWWDSYASDVSADGQVVVGYRMRSSQMAFRWTAADGMKDLGFLSEDFPQSSASAVSADGKTVVGVSGTGSTVEAFVWTSDSGMRRLKEVLIEQGVSAVEGWTLDGAGGISADGLTISGHGRNPANQREAWLATLNPPLNLSLSSVEVGGCKSVLAKVAIASPALAEGVAVTISDTLKSATVPPKVTIQSGATTAAFWIKTTPVSERENGTIQASLGSRSVSSALTVRPMGLTSVTLTPTTVVGSNGVTGKATLECNAGPGPIAVDLSSNNAGVASPVAASVVVPQGLKSAYFDVATDVVLTKSYATIAGTANGITKSKKLTVNVAATISPTGLKFGTVSVGQRSAALSATLTNKGAVPFWVNSISLTGTAPSWFAQMHNCPASLDPGTSCAISVTFTPLTAASKSAKLSIATSATATPLSVSLSGTGI